jgi:D-tagatose-1,6-bisphosphate aldolase subunit GatZ/KbaZ
MNYLDTVVTAQKTGEARGIASICSAHPFVLEAALQHGQARNVPVLIEATCNQVNQFGGYTGMTPADFISFVAEIADRVGFSRDDLMLGGDHLGPLVWSDQPAGKAMENAKDLVRAYVQAGFTKIHMDSSMPCADDEVFSMEVAARRTAELVDVAETTAGKGSSNLRYIIGTEVPSAGGAKAGETHLTVTEPASAAQTIDQTRHAFSSMGLDSAWERVIALVVQPGVEFGAASIHDYDRVAAAGLARLIETVPGLVYEAHSTDYQTRAALRALAEDHFAILKVGPGLTFAFREAVFALAEMEEILEEGETSHLREVLEAAMLENPTYWEKHFNGTSGQQKISRAYSFSDRIRYYWNGPAVQSAFSRLMSNLGDRPLPLSLLSQYLPGQYLKVRSGEIKNHPHEVLLSRVMDVLDDYVFACEA